VQGAQQAFQTLCKTLVGYDTLEPARYVSEAGRSAILACASASRITLSVLRQLEHVMHHRSNHVSSSPGLAAVLMPSRGIALNPS
jgi:hypothetical protein